MGIDCSNSIYLHQVQVLSYCKYSLLFTCSWDWTCNLQMILLRSTFQPNTYIHCIIGNPSFPLSPPAFLLSIIPISFLFLPSFYFLHFNSLHYLLSFSLYFPSFLLIQFSSNFLSHFDFLSPLAQLPFSFLFLPPTNFYPTYFLSSI